MTSPAPFLFRAGTARNAKPGPFIIGVLEGEGVGPDLVHVCLDILSAVGDVCGARFEFRNAGRSGMGADGRLVRPTAPELLAFFRDCFTAGAPVMAGPGGGRFVYELRKEFDLFCKLVPVRPFAELRGAGRLRAPHADDVDIMLIRENASGLYFGTHKTTQDPVEGKRVEYSFSYSEREVRRVLEVGATLALGRRRKLAVVMKQDAIPGMSDLWRDCTQAVAAASGVEVSLINVDYAAYAIVQHPRDFDVIVTSNLLGDILADVTAVLVGSRGMTFSGNFAADGSAVYQTNHGAAWDLVGTDKANPAGQVLATAMMLRTSLGLGDEANLVERALADVWRRGARTADIAETSCEIIGTREMGRRIVDAIGRLAPARGSGS